MDNFLYINAGLSALVANITAGQTTFSVSSPGRFPTSVPAGQVLVLTLHPAGLPSTQEIVHCTAIAAGVFTVVRGAQGTTASAWVAGTVVGAYLTASIMAQIFDEIDGHAGAGGAVHALATTVAAGFMSAAMVTKLNGIANGATAYVHPANHPPSIITQDVNNRFTTDTEKGNWNAAKNHADSPHSPSDAQKNADITKEEIEAKLTGAIASHGHDAYLPKAGGTLAGNLTIQNAAPTISFIDTDNADRSLHCNSNLIGFLNSGGGWSFYSHDDGQNVSPNNMIIGSSTHRTDGDIYMPWAGDWLSNVLGRKLGSDVGHNNIGSLCFAGVTYNDSKRVGSPGALLAGSVLHPAGLTNTYTGDAYYTRILMHGSTLSGTWRCLGTTYYDNNKEQIVSLWQRVG